MIIEKNISKYVVFSEDTIISALKKISDNKSRIIFSVNESGILEGVMTDGDFRRWIVSQTTIDLNQPVSKASNKNFRFARSYDDDDKILACFSENIEFVPLVDGNGRLTAIARESRSSDGIRIGKFTINLEAPVFVIAEIGINHNGSLELAKKLVDAAVEAGADCAKFQMRHLRSLYRNEGTADSVREDLGVQYTLDLITRFQLSPEEMFAAFDYCKKQGILPLCTPWDFESLALLEEYGMEGYKVASADLTNHDLLTAIARTGKPLICSIGMSTEGEIIESVNLLRRLGAAYVLLQCNSTYPAPFKDVNLNYLDRLIEIGECPVGYSGHERGISVVIAAVAKGAKVIEKHLTLDKSMEGNDHKVSLLPEEFKRMVESIRQVEESLGSCSEERRLSQGELINRVTLAKSLVIDRDLKPGQTITAEMIQVKSPGRGLQPNQKAQLVGQKAKRPFKAGDYFFPSDLMGEEVKPRNYSLRRAWGIPVRYHDFKAILSKSNPDFLEFHLTYKDLGEEIGRYFDQTYDLALVVHSPDLFTGDHLLNLAAIDRVYRQRSVKELQRVIEITRTIKPFFAKSMRPFIVVSVGGFTRDAPLDQEARAQLYELVAESLCELDAEGVEIIPQTLPPFPWYLGGQLYLNLFVEAKDTARFCQQHGYRVCLDISHSKLACNHYKWSFKEFLEEIGPYAAHLHIADAEGVDGEGLQIGEGGIDFPALAEMLGRVAPSATFIPEIWQGHKNEGEGFWTALERLEKWF